MMRARKKKAVKKKMFRILISLVIVLNASILFSQSGIRVTAARGKIAAINAGANRGITTGTKYVLLRNTGQGAVEVGVVQVEKVMSSKAGIRLIESRRYDSILSGDYLGNVAEDSLDDLFGDSSFNTNNTNTTTLSKSWNNSSNRQYQSGNSGNDQQSGYAAGQRDAGNDISGGTWFVVGCLTGGFSYIYPDLWNPAVPQGQLVGKSPAFVAGYTDGYNAKRKDVVHKNSCLGGLIYWGGCLVYYIAVVATYSSY